jgi:hypothetical protein
MARVLDEKRISLAIARDRQIVPVEDGAAKSHASACRTFGTLRAKRALVSTRPLDSRRAFGAAGTFWSLGAFFTGRTLRTANQAEVHPITSVPEPEVPSVFSDPAVAHRVTGHG